MDVREIGDRIKYARTLRNYTLDDIANEIGVAKSTIQRYENGLITKPKLPVLQAIAESLKVNPAWLSGKDGHMVIDESVSGIIKKRLEELNMSLEEVAQKADIPLNWLKKIDSFIPGDMEFMIQKDKGHPLEWGDEIYGFTSYEWITRVAKAIELPGSKLRTALARQEVPLYNSPSLTAEEAFKHAQEDFEYPLIETNENIIIDTIPRAPENIRAAARDMTELSLEDQKTVFDMINFLSQKGKEAKET